MDQHRPLLTQWPRMLREERGVVMVLAYVVVAVLLVLNAAYLDRMVTDHKHVGRYGSRLQALHLSEAGVDKSITKLRDLPPYVGEPYTPLGVAGAYETTVQATGFVDPINDIFPWLEHRIESTGYHPTTQPTPEEREVTVMIDRMRWPFTHALVAGEPIHVTGGGAVISCFDSRWDAPWPPPDSCPPGSRVATNAVGANSILVTGALDAQSAEVACGVGCNPPTDINVGPGSDITPTTLLAPKVFDPPNFSGVPSEGPLHLMPGETRTLSPGRHRFSSLTLEENSLLTASGPVQIIIDGEAATMSFAPGARITAPGSMAEFFQLYLVPPAMEWPPIPLNDVEIEAAMYVYGDLPTLRVEGNVRFYGSLATSGPVNFVIAGGNLKMMYDWALSGRPRGDWSLPPIEYQVETSGWKLRR